MHDIGKLASDLTWRERFLAIVISKTVGVGTARRWARSGRGMRRRIGSYLIHGELGARMVRDAGGREEVAVWSEVHQGYRQTGRLAIPPDVVTALIESDAV